MFSLDIARISLFFNYFNDENDLSRVDGVTGWVNIYIIGK